MNLLNINLDGDSDTPGGKKGSINKFHSFNLDENESHTKYLLWGFHYSTFDF
jgi:hypothetical protein